MSEVIAILITGSNQGLGFETARQLSKLPHVHLFLSGRDPIRVREASGKITTEEGCQALVDEVIIDVANDDTIKMAHTEVESKLQGKALDVLINNAAVFTADPDVLTRGLRSVFRSTFAVNVFGAAIVAEVFLPLLKKSTTEGGARILNVSSSLGSNTKMSNWKGVEKSRIGLAYCASKSALNSVTCTLAMINPDIHVVSLDPGYSNTSMSEYDSNAADPKDAVKIIMEHALGKVGKSPGFYSKSGELGW